MPRKPYKSLLETMNTPVCTITPASKAEPTQQPSQNICATVVLASGRAQAVLIYHTPLKPAPKLSKAVIDLIYGMLPTSAKLYPLCSKRWSSRILSYSAVVAVDDWCHASDPGPPLEFGHAITIATGSTNPRQVPKPISEHAAAQNPPRVRRDVSQHAKTHGSKLQLSCHEYPY